MKDGQDAFEKTTRQIQCEVESLEDDIQLAQAKLHSLEEIPSHRPWYGRANFTCTNCHYKGHKVSKPCTLPACGGYNECGILAMHSDHKVEINKAKQEIKTLTKKLKGKKEEKESMELMKGRTKSNFFSIMRPRLLECDPIKYSCRQTLENDLRILAAACNHKVPKDNGSDLEEMIRKKKDDCKSYVTPNSSSNFSPQTPSSRYENRPTGSVKQQSRRDSRNMKHRGEQWRKSLGDGPVTNNRHPSTNHPLSPNVTSRFSPYRRESPSSYRLQPAPYGNLWPVATSTPNRHYGKYTRSPSDSARRSINYPASPTARENNRSLNNSLSLIDTTQEAAGMLLDLYNDRRQ